MRDLSWQTISQYSTDIGCQPAGPAQAAIQAVLNDLEALKASKDLEATCHGHKIWGVNPISIDRPSFAFQCFRLRWLLVEQTWQLLWVQPQLVCDRYFIHFHPLGVVYAN